MGLGVSGFRGLGLSGFRVYLDLRNPCSISPYTQYFGLKKGHYYSLGVQTLRFKGFKGRGLEGFEGSRVWGLRGERAVGAQGLRVWGLQGLGLGFTASRVSGTAYFWQAGPASSPRENRGRNEHQTELHRVLKPGDRKILIRVSRALCIVTIRLKIARAPAQ